MAQNKWHKKHRKYFHEQPSNYRIAQCNFDPTTHNTKYVNSDNNMHQDREKEAHKRKKPTKATSNAT